MILGWFGYVFEVLHARKWLRMRFFTKIDPDPSPDIREHCDRAGVSKGQAEGQKPPNHRDDQCYHRAYGLDYTMW